jgi:phosphoribosylformylglycinamidine cyclo-ligase
MASLTYRDAGVDIDEGDALVERIKPHAQRTARPEVLAGIGGFGGLFEVPKRYREPVMVVGTDGVGTKLKLAFLAKKHDTVGIDLVAMSVNDVVVCGAEPLVFLDYFATSRLDAAEAEQVIKGIAEGCVQAGCALIGGETAELPGIYREGELDFAGTCVGIVERARLIDGTRCGPGDVVLGLPSSGLHTNGFSLVRSLVGDDDFDADLLLAPHRLYLEEVRELRDRADVKALAHVTGGGILGNLTRVLPDGVRIELDWDAWQRPPVFDWLTEQGIEQDEQRRVFNLGIGMCAVVPAADAGAGTVIGRLV